MTPGGGGQRRLRYAADEKPPVPLALGLGLQMALLSVASVVLTPSIVIRAAGGSEAYLSWAVFAAVAISGATTIVQAVRFGRIGAGYVLLMGTSGAFIAVCIAALAEGGPALLATLVVISSLFQFLLAARLLLVRRVLTPAVAGTVIMLIPVTVMPIVFDMLKQVPEGAPEPAALVSAAVALAVILAIALAARGVLRLWAPVIGVAAGSAVGGYFGIYDAASVGEAAWLGFPAIGWPGFDLDFGPVFWGLLPAFAFVTLVGAIETIGDSVAIQQVSWRERRATDYRAVEGAVAADGVGNLASGLAGTVPNTTYSTCISITELTGVAARRVGVAVGSIFLAVAVMPKALAVILAIPAPVVAAYLLALLAMLFVVGMKIVVQDGIDYRKGLVVGVAFWIGVGFQHGVVFPEHLGGFAGGLLQNGMTAGGLAAILLTLALEAAGPRRRRMEAALDESAHAPVRAFLADFAARQGWSGPMAERLEAVGEEMLLTLLPGEEAGEGGPRRLRVSAAREDGAAVLEFVAAATGADANLEDRIALLGEPGVGAPVERELSLRLLRHLASSVRHQQYRSADVVTVHVRRPEG